MTTVARYQYQEVNYFIPFIDSFNLNKGIHFFDQYHTFNCLQDTILTQLGSVVMITTGVMEDCIFETWLPMYGK